MVKYKYVYQDKIGKFYLKARPQFSFGSTLHHVLQEFHEQGAVHTREEMVTTMQTQWISAGYQTQEEEQEHREKGEQIIHAYHEAHQERIEAQIETIATEKTITCDLGFFKLSGRIDRLDRHPDGTLEIIDYKSGRQEVTEEQVRNSLAMTCYQLILRELYPDSPVCATIYALRSGTSATARLTTEEMQEFKSELIALAKEILETDFAELLPEPIEICPDCEFLKICQKYWTDAQKSELFGEPFSEAGL
jgi:RecB family exonuclease